MIVANQWYNIARTDTIGTRTGIRIDFGTKYAMFTVSVDYGNSVITAVESNISKEETKLSVRIRQNNNAWYIDVRMSVVQNTTLKAALYESTGDWEAVVPNTSVAGNTICIINDLTSQITPSGVESLFEIINVGTAENPMYAVVPKKYNGADVGIISYTFMSMAGFGMPDDVPAVVPTLSELNDVLITEPTAGDVLTYNDILGRWVNGPGGINENALSKYLQDNKYITDTLLNNTLKTYLTIEDYNTKISAIEEKTKWFYYDEENDAVRISCNFISDGTMSMAGFGGTDDTGGGLDISAMWSELARVDATKVIDSSHIPDLSNKYLGKSALAGWALAATKPTYTASEVGALSTSGGTINGALIISSPSWGEQLIINRTTANTAPSIKFQNNGTTLGYIGVRTDEKLYYAPSTGGNGYDIIHSGNIGGYAIKRNTAINFKSAVNEAGYGYSDSGWVDNGASLIIGANTSYRFALQATDAYLKYNYCYNNSWKGWKQIASIADNVASATKLQTARTIWGQSFDGSTNVSGDIHLNASAIYWYSDKANYCIESVSRSNASPYLKIAYYGGIHFHTQGTERMRIADGGNVLIGTTDDNGTAKLQLNGNIHLGNGTAFEIGTGYNTGDPTRYNKIVFGAASTGLQYISGSWTNADIVVHDFKVGSGNTTALAITNKGNILIGTTSDDGVIKLQVEGAFKVYETTQRRLYTRINNSGIQVGRNSSLYTGGYNGGLTYGADNTTIGYIAGVYNEASSGSTVFFYGGESSTTAAIRIKGLNGNVLIGTSTDSGYKLDVNGQIKSNGLLIPNYTAIQSKLADNTTVNVLYITNTNVLRVGYSSYNVLLDGRCVGVGAVDTSYKFNVNGTARISSNLTVLGDIISEGTIAMAKLASSSDQKLKDNIAAVSAEQSIGIIRQLRPTTWDWKKDGKKSYGLIAQEVAPIVPEMVVDMGHLHLEYNQLHTFEIGAIKHIDSEVDKLKKDLGIANGRIEALENELKQYRRNA